MWVVILYIFHLILLLQFHWMVFISNWSRRRNGDYVNNNNNKILETNTPLTRKWYSIHPYLTLASRWRTANLKRGKATSQLVSWNSCVANDYGKSIDVNLHLLQLHFRRILMLNKSNIKANLLPSCPPSYHFCNSSRLGPSSLIDCRHGNRVSVLDSKFLSFAPYLPPCHCSAPHSKSETRGNHHRFCRIRPLLPLLLLIFWNGAFPLKIYIYQF